MIEEIIRKGIISSQELQHLRATKGQSSSPFKMLDATFVLPGTPESPLQNYQNRRIPGALFFDIEKISDHTAPLPHTAPTAEIFASALSALGIAPEDLIILYGQHGMTMGPCRIWWTFRLFGHDNVCVLDGGLPEWIRNGGELETTPPLKPSPSTYRIRQIRPGLLKTRDDIAKAMEDGLTPILDARPKARFEGTAPEPRPGMAAGHIPGSRNVPSSELVEQDTGTLKSDEALRQTLTQAGFNWNDPYAPQTIATCGSGITACVIALALFRHGFDKISVYDGSWAEWGQKNAGNKIACGE